MTDFGFMPLVFGACLIAIWLTLAFSSAAKFRIASRSEPPLILPPIEKLPRDIVVRHFREDDRPSCQAIYETNAKSLPPLPELLHRSIDENAAGFLVAEREGKVIACGGLTIYPERRHAALWMGLVDQACHRQGVGTLMLLSRLALTGDFETVGLETTARTAPFYEKFGFRQCSQPEERYPGGHRHFFMFRHVSEETRGRIYAYLRTTSVTFEVDLNPRL